MPRAGKARTLHATTEAKNPTLFEKNSVEDAESVDILDSELLTALGYTPTPDHFYNDFRVVRVPLLTADAANEAGIGVMILSVFRNAGDTGYTVAVGLPDTGLVADTKFVRVRVVPA